MKMVRVLVEDTGVETSVPEAYYEKYAREGLTKLPDVVEKKAPVAKKKPMSKVEV